MLDTTKTTLSRCRVLADDDMREHICLTNPHPTRDYHMPPQLSQTI